MALLIDFYLLVTETLYMIPFTTAQIHLSVDKAIVSWLHRDDNFLYAGVHGRSTRAGWSIHKR